MLAVISAGQQVAQVRDYVLPAVSLALEFASMIGYPLLQLCLWSSSGLQPKGGCGMLRECNSSRDEEGIADDGHDATGGHDGSHSVVPSRTAEQGDWVTT